MKLNKRTGAVLGFLLAAGSATAATGWLTNYTWTSDMLRREPAPAVLVTDDDDGTWTTVKTGTGLKVNGTVTSTVDTSLLATSAKQDTVIAALRASLSTSCASVKRTVAVVLDGSSGTTVDCGATGTVRRASIKNDSRTFRIEVEDSTNTSPIALLPGESYSNALDNASTPDSFVVNTACTRCGGGAVPVSLEACDD